MSHKKDRESAELEDTGGKIRLFVDVPLSAGAAIAATQPQAHYLLHVMRARAGAQLRLFNGKDGEWRAHIRAEGKGRCSFVCDRMLVPQDSVLDLWLIFAPIKKTPADYVAQKATELGVSVLQPVITNRTVARRVNVERLRANAVEAAEQSERLSVPEVREPQSLDALLATWPRERRLIFCDEAGEADSIAAALAKQDANGPWAVLTGPEGGFDAQERAAIRALPSVVPVTLGPRIMRADTAALAALSVFQAMVGDWH